MSPSPIHPYKCLQIGKPARPLYAFVEKPPRRSSIVAFLALATTLPIQGPSSVLGVQSEGVTGADTVVHTALVFTVVGAVGLVIRAVVQRAVSSLRHIRLGHDVRVEKVLRARQYQQGRATTGVVLAVYVRRECMCRSWRGSCCTPSGPCTRRRRPVGCKGRDSTCRRHCLEGHRWHHQARSVRRSRSEP